MTEPGPRIVPIVEGHGEQRAARVLLDRVWREALEGSYLEVLSPIRMPRGRLLQDEHLERALGLAALKLRDRSGLVLLLLDADEDPACELGPRLLQTASELRPDLDFSCVLPVQEYETWFVAAAESLDLLEEGEQAPAKPEEEGLSKAWITRRRTYSETVDQPKLTARMDLAACRRRAPSFDKLCRDLRDWGVGKGFLTP